MWHLLLTVLQLQQSVLAGIGYLNDAEATRAAIDKDGWLHTGDIVCFDAEGYLYIIDRLKEMIKYKGFQVFIHRPHLYRILATIPSLNKLITLPLGYQIAPADLEAILVSHPDVLDTAVTWY